MKLLPTAPATRRYLLALVGGLGAAAAVSSCGSNVFKSQERKDPAEDATIALEKHDEDTAIGTLEDALADDPANPQYLSILALAYAQRAGIEPLQFAARMSANNSGSGSGSGSSTTGIPAAGDYTALFSVMPTASAKHLADLDYAVTILATKLPIDLYQPGDDFKLALYQTASVILHTKALDTNGDGQLSLDEILSLSADAATSILIQIAGAESALGGGNSDDQSKQAAAEAIASFQTQIASQPGATDDEKLKNYLSQSGAAGGDAAAAAAAQGSGSGSTNQASP